MKDKVQIATQQEADLVQRFARGYRIRLADIIGNLNQTMALSQTDPRMQECRRQESLRCCLEAVDLVLASHEQFAKLLGMIATLDLSKLPKN